MEHILNLEQVKKYYGGNSGNITKAVDGISMYVDKGEFVAIMGASGSGKTTLLNCISTIDTVTSGHITVNNQDITKIKDKDFADFRRENLGFIFQDFNLLDTLTIEENISMPSLLDGDKSNIEELVKAFDIGHLLQKYPSDLNHREKMRCICARAFSGGRKVVVIFDLFKRMQEQSKAELAILTYHAAKSLEISALYISEDLDENYGAYDLIYKYRPEKKEFSIIDYRA